MKRLGTAVLASIVIALTLATMVMAAVANGSFETGNFTNWGKTPFVNRGLSALKVSATPGGLNNDLSVIVGGPTTAALSLSDPHTNGVLKYPAYGNYSARVNSEDSWNYGNNPNPTPDSQDNRSTGNTIVQTISAVIDPSDSRSHVRFSYAAVMVNPASGHADEEKPYFRVRVINTSQGNDVIYDFSSFVNEPGKNWQNGEAFDGGSEFWKYIDWQYIDLSSDDEHPITVGDQIIIEITAAGCSLGGHPGYVYVDEVTDGDIAGPSISASGPTTVLAGSTITYTYNYKNGSAAPINPVVIADEPVGVTFTSVSDNTSCTLLNGTVTCNFPTLGVGETGTFTITGDVTTAGGSKIAHGSYSIAATGFPTVGGKTVITNVLAATSTVTATTTTTATATPVATNTTTQTPTNAITATRTATATATRTVTRTATATPITIVLTSIAVDDGWVLESSETSSIGGTFRSDLATIVGDDTAKRQYRGVLSFDTGIVMNDPAASIISIKMTIKEQANFGDPFIAFQGMLFDVKNGFFGTSRSLEAVDFQSAPSGTYGPSVIPPNLVNSVYTFNLMNGAANINKSATSNNGLTQIRIRLKLDDNGDAIANYLNLFTGNSATPANRPMLTITYWP